MDPEADAGEPVEVAVDTDAPALLAEWAALMQAGIPAELWWGASEGEQRRIEDGRVPQEPGLGAILVAPADVPRAESVLVRAQEARVRSHLKTAPRQLRRAALGFLLLAGTPILVALALSVGWRRVVLPVGLWLAAVVMLVLWDAFGGGAARSQRP